MNSSRHQYIDRETATVKTETLLGDPVVNFMYSSVREKAPFLFKAYTSSTFTNMLGAMNYDHWAGCRLRNVSRFARAVGIDLTECVDDPHTLNTPRKVFERRIRYWDMRPMDESPSVIVSPADARMLVGSFSEVSRLFLKGKFFDFADLLGRDKSDWLKAFHDGDYAVLRLTPDKYHYNHMPVTGIVRDLYEISGAYHSCNPGSVVIEATPYSKNKRVVTIVDTDVRGGTGVGLVGMIEVVALMIGAIEQCYSVSKYDHPREITRGMWLVKGQPKSLYRPGSSTDVVMFQKGRMRFSPDLVRNMFRQDASSRFSQGFGKPLVETEVKVRSSIGEATDAPPLWREPENMPTSGRGIYGT